MVMMMMMVALVAVMMNVILTSINKAGEFEDDNDRWDY